MAESSAQPTRDEIVSASRALARVCDGATAMDGAGYNGCDAGFMHDVCRKTSHTDKQLRVMWAILRKYKKQLAGFGIDYDALVPPPMAAAASPRMAGASATAQRRAALKYCETKHGRRVVVQFAYNPDLVKVVQGLPKRWFDKEGA